MDWHTHFQESYSKLVKRVDTVVFGDIPSLFGYDRKSVKSRLNQKFIEVCWSPYLIQFQKNPEFLSLVGDRCYLSPVSIDFCTRKIQLSRAFLLRNIIVFILRWLEALYWFFKSIFDKKFIKPATLVYGIPQDFISSSDARQKFNDFVHYGPLAEIFRSTLILEGSSRICDPLFSVTKNPLLKLLSSTRLDLEDGLYFLVSHLGVFFYYFYSVIRFPFNAVLANDIAVHAVVGLLIKLNRIQSVVITSSNFTDQQLWMSSYPEKNYRLNLVYYSQNNTTMLLKSDPISDMLPRNPHFPHVSADIHWVWTSNYANYLAKVGVRGEFRAVGPILFCLPSRKAAARRETKSFTITLFEITPWRGEIREARGFGNYWSTENVTEFVSDIVRLKNDLNLEIGKQIKISLKAKRAYHAIHDRSYIGFLSELEGQGQIELVDYRSDLFELVDQSDVVISIPFTTAALVATSRNIPSIYYDATGELLGVVPPYADVIYCNNFDNLLLVVKNLYNRST